MKLSEIINEGKYFDIMAKLPPDTQSKIKDWYDNGDSYVHMATRLNQMLNRYTFSFETIPKLLNKIYPDRVLRNPGVKAVNNASGILSHDHHPDVPLYPNEPEYDSEISEMYANGANLLEISKKFSISKAAINSVIHRQPNFRELKQSRRASLNI